jgi:hypothetical protein
VVKFPDKQVDNITLPAEKQLVRELNFRIGGLELGDLLPGCVC